MGGPFVDCVALYHLPYWELGASGILAGGWARKPGAADRPWNLPHLS